MSVARLPWIKKNTREFTRINIIILVLSYCLLYTFSEVTVTKIGVRWVDQNLVSNSLNGFRVSSYNCTAYCCLQLWFTKAYKNVGGTSANFKITFWSAQRSPTLVNVYLPKSNTWLFTWDCLCMLRSAMPVGGLWCLCLSVVMRVCASRSRKDWSPLVARSGTSSTTTWTISSAS